MRKTLIGVGVLIVVIAVSLGAWAMMSERSDSRVASSQQKRYVALGDSVAAGIGAGDYADASACNRTKASYAAVLADESGYQLTSLACSGAQVPLGVTGAQQVNGLSVQPQLEQLFAGPKPDIITMTIGANDIGWTRFVDCYTGTCGGEAERQQLNGLLSAFRSNLNATLTAMQTSYEQSPPTVAVTGYYQLLPKNTVATCREMIGIDKTELAWARSVISSLNQTIEDVVKTYDFSTYVNIDFDGHELCTSEPWVQGVDATAPFHPTDRGQKQIAQNIIAATDK